MNKELVIQPNTVVRARTIEERIALCKFAKENDIWSHYTCSFYSLNDNRFHELGQTDFDFYEGVIVWKGYSDSHNYKILTIDDIKENKMEITLTEEQMKAWENGEDIVITSPKKNHEVEYEGCYIVSTTRVLGKMDGNDADYKTHGRYRKTKSNADFAFKRNQQSNRLEAKVEELQGDVGVGDYSLNCDDRYNHYEAIDRVTYLPFIGEIRMKEETAKEICRLLNKGLWSMDEIL